MTNNRQDVLDPIIDALRAGRCILCAGPRIQDGVGFRQLVERLFAAASEPEDGDEARRTLQASPLTAAAHVRRRLGDEFPGLLKQVTGAGAALSDSVAALARLPFRAFVTTSYGDLLARATADAAVPVYTPADTDGLVVDTGERFIFKVLGDPARPETLIWTAADVVRALSNEAYQEFASGLYRRHTFLFTGFEPADTDFRILIERVLCGAGAAEGGHFAFMPAATAIEREELGEAYGIHVLDTGALALPDVVAALTAAVADVAPASTDRLEELLLLWEREPGRADVATRLDLLEATLRRAGAHERLIDLYVGRVALEPKPARRAEILLDLAQLLERESGDLDRALSARLAALREAPAASGFERLEKLAAATERSGEVVDALAEAAPALDLRDRVEAYLRAAVVADERLGDLERALSLAREALAADPDHRATDDRVLELLRRTEAWDEVAAALEARAARARSAVASSQALAEAAVVADERLGDAERALSLAREALAADPGSLEARELVETLLRRAEDPAQLAKFLDEWVDSAPRERRAAIRRELAELCERTLADRDGALRHYEALREDGPADVSVLRALEQNYRERGKLGELAAVLREQIGALESPRERLDTYRELADVCESLGDVAGAAESLEWVTALADDGAASGDDGDDVIAEALSALQRLYVRAGNVRAAIDAALRNARRATPERAVDLYLSVADIYERELEDTGRALDVLAEAERRATDTVGILAREADLFAARGEYRDAVAALERCAHAATDSGERAAALCRAGEIAWRRLDDAERAERLLSAALAAQPEHVASVRALVSLCLRQGESARAAALADRGAAVAGDPRDRAALAAAAADALVALERPEEATARYAEAVRLDPEDADTAEKLAELLAAQQRRSELVALLERLADAPAPLPVRLARLERYAAAAAGCGDVDRAHAARARAAALAPTEPATVRAYAESELGRGGYGDAYRALERAFAAGAGADDPGWWHAALARCAVEIGAVEAAREHIARALAVDPAHAPSLRLRVDIERAAGDPNARIAAIQGYLALAPQGEQAALWAELGDVCATDLGDRARALAAYRCALSSRADDHIIAHKSLGILVDDRRWGEASEMLVRLIATEHVPAVRAKYRYTAAGIARELGRADEAVACLWAALEDDPGFARAATKLESLLAARRDLGGLARLYCEQIRAIGPDADDGRAGDRLELWDKLAAVCRDSGDRDGAISALEVAVTLDGDLVERWQRLADLYATRGPDGYADAIACHERMVSRQKHRLGSYRELASLHRASGRLERAEACVAAAAVLEIGSGRSHKSAPATDALPPAAGVVTGAMWTALHHPDEERFVTALFKTAAPAFLADRTLTRKQLATGRSELAPASGAVITRVLADVCDRFGVSHPPLYVCEDEPRPLQVALCRDQSGVTPALIAGRGVLSGVGERELAFRIGRIVADFRGGRIARFILPTPAELVQILDAAVAIGAGDEGAARGREVARTVEHLTRGLSPVALDQVATLGRILADRDLDSATAALAWVRAIDLGASRAALVAAGDVRTCTRVLAAEPPVRGGPSAEERVLDLVWSSVTDAVLGVRAHVEGWHEGAGSVGASLVAQAC